MLHTMDTYPHTTDILDDPQEFDDYIESLEPPVEEPCVPDPLDPPVDDTERDDLRAASAPTGAQPPATEKQRSYLTSLHTQLSQVKDVDYPDLSKVALTRAQASTLIQDALARAQNQGVHLNSGASPRGSLPATEKQLDYIDSLAHQVDEDVDTTNLTRAEASTLIKRLLNLLPKTTGYAYVSYENPWS